VNDPFHQHSTTDDPYQGLALVETITDAIVDNVLNTGDFDALDNFTILQLLAAYVNISFLAVNLFTNLLIPFMIGMSHILNGALGADVLMGSSGENLVDRAPGLQTHRNTEALPY
jgi:hypothetical protein